MSERIPEIPGGRLLEGPSARGGGNLLFVVETEAGPRLLKLYRRRRSRWRGPWRTLGHWLEGKRGVGPAARARTERELLALWHGHGIDVPRLHDDPLPPGVDGPGAWMAYCPGPTLEDEVARQGAGAAELVRSYAQDLATRHDLARDHRDVRLVHEHPGIVHVLLHADRRVSFDLEGAWRSARFLERALVEEVAGVVRSICKAAQDAWPQLISAFAAGYGRPETLRGIIRRGTRGGVRARLRRLRGTARRALRGKLSKAEALRRLGARMDAAEGESNPSPQ